MDDKVRYRVKEVLLVLVVVILSILFILIYGLNPLNHDFKLSYLIGMGTFTVSQFIGEMPFIKRKMRRIIYMLIIMPILIGVYFLI